MQCSLITLRCVGGVCGCPSREQWVWFKTQCSLPGQLVMWWKIDEESVITSLCSLAQPHSLDKTEALPHHLSLLSLYRNGCMWAEGQQLPSSSWIGSLKLSTTCFYLVYSPYTTHVCTQAFTHKAHMSFFISSQCKYLGWSPLLPSSFSIQHVFPALPYIMPAYGLPYGTVQLSYWKSHVYF